MTRHVVLRTAQGRAVNESELAALFEIERRAMGVPWGAPIALGELGQAIGRCGRTTRRVCQMLQEHGLITMCIRHDTSGKQLENEYALTDAGRALLEAARGQGHG